MAISNLFKNGDVKEGVTVLQSSGTLLQQLALSACSRGLKALSALFPRLESPVSLFLRLGSPVR
jgi:hypothetical protein